MSSLIRFFDNNSTLVCGIIIHDDVGFDLIRWIYAHPCPSIVHLCSVYRLYSRHKYKEHMVLMHEAHGRHKIAWKYDIVIKNNQLVIKLKDYKMKTKVNLFKN